MDHGEMGHTPNARAIRVAGERIVANLTLREGIAQKAALDLVPNAPMCPGSRGKRQPWGEEDHNGLKTMMAKREATARPIPPPLPSASGERTVRGRHPGADRRVGVWPIVPKQYDIIVVHWSSASGARESPIVPFTPWLERPTATVRRYQMPFARVPVAQACSAPNSQPSSRFFANETLNSEETKCTST
jgi:hypothetical protein